MRWPGAAAAVHSAVHRRGPLRYATGDRWFVDETYVKVAGRWRYRYRAVDQYGQVIDVLLSEQRDNDATLQSDELNTRRTCSS